MSAIELNAHPSKEFATKLEQSLHLLTSAEVEYAPLTQASSLGAEDMVITHLLHETGIDCSVFVLDTGRLHAETLELVDRIERRYGRNVAVYRPNPLAVQEWVSRNGVDAIYESVALRKQCCEIRKLQPLERALNGHSGWITGLRREQSANRAEVLPVEPDGQRVKINPLARWTWGDVWHYIAINRIPYNPLHDQFFPSIGCAPCTRAISAGEDFRAGRWWWEQESAKECGLHPSTPARVIPIQEAA